MRTSQPSSFTPVFSWTWRKEPSNGSSRLHARYTRGAGVSEVHVQMQTCVNVFIDAQIHTYIPTSPAHLACPSGEVDSALQLCSLSSARHEFLALYCMFSIPHSQFFQIDCSRSWTATVSHYTWIFLGFMENLTQALTETWIWEGILRCSIDFIRDKMPHFEKKSW